MFAFRGLTLMIADKKSCSKTIVDKDMFNTY